MWKTRGWGVDKFDVFLLCVMGGVPGLMFSLWSPSGLWRGISFNGFSCVCMRAWRAVMIDDEMDEDQTRGMES